MTNAKAGQKKHTVDSSKSNLKPVHCLFLLCSVTGSVSYSSVPNFSSCFSPCKQKLFLPASSCQKHCMARTGAICLKFYCSQYSCYIVTCIFYRTFYHQCQPFLVHCHWSVHNLCCPLPQADSSMLKHFLFVALLGWFQP